MKNRRTKILRFAFLVFGFALCGVGFWLVLAPPCYRAETRIKLNIGSEPGCIEPGFIEIECEIIQDPVVLSNVVEALNLNAKWNSGGGRLKTAETLRLLKRQMTVRCVPNDPYLIEVSATSKDPKMAARIANAIAEAYIKFRLKQSRQLLANEIKSFEESYRLEDKEIRAEQEKVEQLRERLGVPNPEPAEEQLKTNCPAYFDERQKLKDWRDFQELLGKKIEQTKSDLNQPHRSSFEIIEVASPPAAPSGPDRVLGALLCAIGLFPSVGGFLLLKSSRRPSD